MKGSDLSQDMVRLPCMEVRVVLLVFLSLQGKSCIHPYYKTEFISNIVKSKINIKQKLIAVRRKDGDEGHTVNYLLIFVLARTTNKSADPLSGF